MEDEKQKPIQLDPTSLTTQNLWREIEHLKELLKNEISGVEKAVKVAHDDLVRVPTDVQRQVAGLKELHEKWFVEKFNGIEKLYADKCSSLEKLHDQKVSFIEKQFNERDIRVEHAARDRKATVDGELAAQEKAATKQNENLILSINKSELLITKQGDQQATLIETIRKGFEDKIQDVKDRITTIESIAAGALGQKTERRSDSDSTWKVIAVIAMVLFGILGYIINK